MPSGLTEEKIIDKNKDLLIKFDNDVNKSYDENEKLFMQLKKKMNTSYNITIILYISMFILGVVLLLIPILAALFGVASLNSLFSGTLGIADLVVLLLFRPVEKIHNNMSDLSQLSIIINSYQQQLSLRLLELDINNRDSLGNTASNINMTTTNIVKLIQKYTETDDKYTETNEKPTETTNQNNQNEFMNQVITKIEDFLKEKTTKKDTKKAP
ncbi:MAG: hypothetical protein LLF83_09070 [Methanobacterium sp.]|nr:hypothetical protein [Methanobacterium sp.]